MAYNDIRRWGMILESEDAEQRAYDEACERRAEKARDLDEKEFWEQDQDEVDPKTMGIGECGDLEEVDLDSVEDEDEQIDFSQYGVCEADDREPLTKASCALGRPASTASLDAQDSVTLAEALSKLAEAISGKKTLDEGNEGTDAGWLAWAGGEEKVKDWDEQTKVASRALFGELVKKGKIDGETGARTKAATDADLKRMAKDYRDATGEDFDRDPADSKKALEQAKKFYEQWLDDPDFREKYALKGKDGETLMKPANPARPNGGKVIAGTDPNAPGPLFFKACFDAMTPADQEEFAKFAAERGRRFTTKHYAPAHSDNSLNKRGSLHGTGDDDDGENPLAQHGVDQTFNADNADDALDDDPESGEEFYSQFDMDAAPGSHAGVAKDIVSVAAQFGKERGMTADEVFGMFARNDRIRRIQNTVKKAGKEGRELLNTELEYMFDTMDPADLEQFKNELKAEAKDEKERTFVDFLFRFGENRKVTLKDRLKEYGIAANQGGDTGAGTQQGDTLMYVIICALAQYYNVSVDDADELWRVKASQSPSKRDRELGVEPRKYSRHLACKILQDLFDELADYQMKGAPRVVIPQSPAEGPKIKSKEWAEVQKKIGGLLTLIMLSADKSEQAGVTQAIKDAMEKYQGKAGERGERHAGKLKTYLTAEQNDEFQELVRQVRTGFDEMSDEAKIRLLELDRMRMGDTLTDA